MELKHINSILPLDAFAESRPGGRSENQDSWQAADTPLGFVVTVCDGMGGGPGGKTASAIAARTIIKTCMECVEMTTPPEDGEGTLIEMVDNECDERQPQSIDAAMSGNAGEIEDKSPTITFSSACILAKAVQNANQAILDATIDNPKLRGMGSTCTILLITQSQKAYIVHLGDSRVYQLRGRKKVFRTFDHSMVFELVKQNVITEEQARLSAQSNIITRALGVADVAEPEIECVTYKPGDRFLLCTDGIHGTMPENELIKRATGIESIGRLVDDMATFVDGEGRKCGGDHDNLTLVLVQINKKSIIHKFYENLFNR